MKEYLSKFFDYETNEIANSYDDLPTWSSIPGNLLLENIIYNRDKTVVDIGFGTGFPLIQLAQKFGNSSKIIGVDLWSSAIKKAEQKIVTRKLSNIELIKTDASDIPLKTESVDIITSNLGINNFANPTDVIKECYRILKPNGTLYLTSNLIGTFEEFYIEFEKTANELDHPNIIEKLHSHIESRSTNEGLNNLFNSNGFEVIETVEKTYQMKYADGTAFLNDYFTIMSFMPTWKNLIPFDELQPFFNNLELRLNALAMNVGELILTVPVVLKKIKKPLINI